MQLSKKQNEYIVNATHRWNFKSGAVRSGKSYVDTSSLECQKAPSNEMY